MSAINCIKLYRTPNGWRWRITDARSRKIIAASTEAYTKRINALANLRRVTGKYLAIPGKGRGISYSWAVKAWSPA